VDKQDRVVVLRGDHSLRSEIVTWWSHFIQLFEDQPPRCPFCELPMLPDFEKIAHMGERTVCHADCEASYMLDEAEAQEEAARALAELEAEELADPTENFDVGAVEAEERAERESAGDDW
jgi:hypothetical protein